ncbi:exosortase/archaeosortase family protein [Lentisphaera profundi]|uniref:Exosortase/archaeosortase family protein n=1 Tax=Lentisphaera profundi TaxID=1658616 RepID=A0ABY7W0A3_9BACT|nr:exosortase/archaeosortase family protein [Lentisphaera profundi]WDE98547.1 exosortase/archaeosortase family protein [Lentisphaera profundi]
MAQTLFTKSLVHKTVLISSCLLIVLYFGEVFDQLWGTQLRLISAIFSEYFLSYLGMDIERQFTILEVGNMSFDIIPACNGSKSIKISLISSCILAIASKKLTGLSKFIFIMLSIPLAVFVNSIRVSALVGLSYLSGSIIHADTLLHTIIGLVFFAINIYMLTKILELMISLKQATFKINLLYPAILMTCLVMLPFFTACIRDWKGTIYNQNDTASFLFFIWGIGIYAFLAFKSSKNHSDYLSGILMMIFILAITSLIQLFSMNNYILGFCFLVSLHSFNTIEYGFQNSLKKTPLLFIIFMAYPKTNEQVMEMFNLSLDHVLISKFIIAVLLSSFVLSRTKTIKYTCTRPLPFICYKYILVATCFLFGIQLYSSRKSPVPLVTQSFYYPYILNNWEGFDLEVNDQELIKRIYTKGSESAGLMIISSEGDSKNIHTPEYCQFGIGWEVSSRQQIQYSNTKFSDLNVTKLKLKQEGLSREFIYWFQSDDFTCATYSEFIAHNTMAQLQGKQLPWLLYITWSDNCTQLEKDFIPILPEIQVNTD